jgi:hypothetical protein
MVTVAERATPAFPAPDPAAAIVRRSSEDVLETDSPCRAVTWVLSPMWASTRLSVRIVEFATPTAILPAPAALPEMTSMVTVSAAAISTLPWEVMVPPLILASVVLARSLIETEPPRAKSAAPAPPAVIEKTVASEMADTEKLPAPELTVTVESLLAAVIVLSISL